MATTLRTLAEEYGIPLENLARVAAILGNFHPDKELDPKDASHIWNLYCFNTQQSTRKAPLIASPFDSSAGAAESAAPTDILPWSPPAPDFQWTPPAPAAESPPDMSPWTPPVSAAAMPNAPDMFPQTSPGSAEESPSDISPWMPFGPAAVMPNAPDMFPQTPPTPAAESSPDVFPKTPPDTAVKPSAPGVPDAKAGKSPAPKRAGPSAKKSPGRKLTPMESMDRLISERYILADVSCFLEPSTGKFLEHALPLLKHYGKQLCIPYSALAQMSAWAKTNPDKDLRKRCAKRLRGLLELQKQNMIDVREKKGMENPAQEILTFCAYFRMSYPLLVITQDISLAKDALKLNQQQSSNGKTILVKKIDENGYLSDLGRKIWIAEKPRAGQDEPLSVTNLPKESDTVIAVLRQGGKPLQLTEHLGHGGEGTIYRTNTPYVAKIYKPECCTAYRKEKIQVMLEADLSFPGICFPRALLRNQQGEFVGYLMDEAKGVTVYDSIFAPRDVFLDMFPGWKKADLVQCALTVLKKIQYLHQHNILVGDINPHNFLVVSPTEIYLVDTDSFQINDIPCPVGFPGYTAPEIHKRHRDGDFQHYSEMMRTKKNEDFSVATFLFMLLLPGKRPYAQQGNTDLVGSILEMNLPYPLGEKKGKNSPSGEWRFIWSHFPYRIKEDFHKVFNKTPETSEFNQRERLSVDAWVYEMETYLKQLGEWERELQENPKSMKADPQSLILFPDRFKHQEGVRYLPCQNCGTEYAEADLKAGFCFNCQKLGETVSCCLCNRNFTLTNYDKYYLKIDKTAPLFCGDCREKGEERTCLNCGSAFVFTNFDRYYRYRKYDKAPRFNGLLCPDCAKRNKEVAYRADCEVCGEKKVEVSIGYLAYLKSKNKRLPKYCTDCHKKWAERQKRGDTSSSDVSASLLDFNDEWGREAWED